MPYLGICLGMQVAVIEFARHVCGMEHATSTEFDEETKEPVVIFMPEIDPTKMGGTMRLGARATVLRSKQKEWKRGTEHYVSSHVGNGTMDRLSSSSSSNLLSTATSTSSSSGSVTAAAEAAISAAVSGVGSAATAFEKEMEMELGIEKGHNASTLAQKIYGGGAKEVLARHRHRYEVNPERVEAMESKGLRFTGTDETGKRMEITELPQSVHPFYFGCQYHPEYQSRPLTPSPPFMGFLLASSGQFTAKRVQA